MKNKRMWLTIGIAAAAVVALVLIFARKPAETSYKTAKVERGDVISMIAATGTVEPVTSVDVSSQVSGNIQDVLVDFNSMVTKGQVIAQIDPTPFKARLEQSDASLTKAKIAVQDAKRTLDRNVELLSKNLIAQSDKDGAQTAYDNASASLKQAQASYELAVTDLKNTTITSPMSGTVVSRNIEAGQTVAASFSAPTLFTIARDLVEMQIEANIDEGDIGRVKAGQDAVFTVDAFPEDNFNGKVSQVRLSPVIVQRVVTYIVVIKVRNDELLLKPGMTANISIIADKRNGVLKVSNAALRFKPPVVPGQDQKNAKNSGSAPASVKPQSAGNSFPQNRGGQGSQGFARRGQGRQMDAQFAAGQSREGKSAGQQAVMGTIWVLENGSLRPIKVKTGITDGAFTEAQSPDITEGMDAATGINTGKAGSTQMGSPFFPQRPRGR